MLAIIPLHCLGFALNPHFYDINYLQSPTPRGMPRRPPNSDKEVVKGLLEALTKLVKMKLSEDFYTNKCRLFKPKRENLDQLKMMPHL